MPFRHFDYLRHATPCALMRCRRRMPLMFARAAPRVFYYVACDDCARLRACRRQIAERHCYAT